MNKHRLFWIVAPSCLLLSCSSIVLAQTKNQTQQPPSSSSNNASTASNSHQNTPQPSYVAVSLQNLSLPTLTLINDNVKAELQNIAIKNMQSNGQHNSGAAKAQQITLSAQNNDTWQEGQPVVFVMKNNNVEVNYDFKYVKPFWYGQQSLNIDTIELQNLVAKKTINLTNFAWQLNINQSNNTSNLQAGINIKNITDGKTNIGPATFKFSVNGLNTQTLAKIAAESAYYSYGYENNAPPQGGQPGFDMTPVLKLFSDGFNVKVNQLTVNSPDGQLQANAEINFPKSPKPYPNIAFIPLAAEASINATAPRVMVANIVKSSFIDNNPKLSDKQAQQLADKQIALWLKNKLLAQKGKDLTFELEYKNASLTINGVKRQPPQPAPAPQNGQRANNQQS